VPSRFSRARNTAARLQDASVRGASSRFRAVVCASSVTRRRTGTCSLFNIRRANSRHCRSGGRIHSRKWPISVVERIWIHLRSLK